MEAKPHLVGIHERVRSDIEGSVPSTGSTQPQKTPPVMKTADGSQPRYTHILLMMHIQISSVIESNLSLVLSSVSMLFIIIC